MKDYKPLKRYSVSDEVTKHWTRSAVDCYKLGCNCSLCNIPDFIETPCRMKATVLTLVRKLGTPPETIYRGYYR